MALPVPAYRHPTGSRCPLKHLHFLHTNPTTEAQLWALQRRAMLWCDPGQPPISMSIHPPPGAGFDVVRSHIGNSWTCGAARVPAQSDAKSTLMRARKISWLHPSPPPTVTTTHPSFGEGKVTWLSGRWSLTHPASPAKPSPATREGHSPGRRVTLLHAHSTSMLSPAEARAEPLDTAGNFTCTQRGFKTHVPTATALSEAQIRETRL